MKFSMIFEPQVDDATPEREHATIHDCVEQAVFAEEVGFDRVWAVEHHSLVEYSHMPAPEIFLTAVAAQTRRIRVGEGPSACPSDTTTQFVSPSERRCSMSSRAEGSIWAQRVARPSRNSHCVGQS